MTTKKPIDLATKGTEGWTPDVKDYLHSTPHVRRPAGGAFVSRITTNYKRKGE